MAMVFGIFDLIFIQFMGVCKIIYVDVEELGSWM